MYHIFLYWRGGTLLPVASKVMGEVIIERYLDPVKEL